MNWIDEAANKLKQYPAKKKALEIIPKQIAEIDSTMTSIRSARMDGTPVRGGGNRREDLLLNCIVQKEELENCLERARLWVRCVDRGLAVLDPEERLVLERLVIYPAKGNAERLCGELFVEQTQVYRRRKKALQKFTVAMYGCTES